MGHSAGWILLTFGDRRSWAGNSGYDDDPTRLYRYDSFVPNHRQIKEGDIALVRSKTTLLGVAQIVRIRQSPGTKERHRCPICQSSNFTRRRRTGDSRCPAGHVFVEPEITFVDCIKYEADFNDTFVATPGALTIDDLRDAALQYNRQLAMQRVDLALISRKLFRANPAAEFLLRGGYIGGDAGDEIEIYEDDYLPGGHDTRRAAFRAIRARRGQKQFRDRLRQRYGDACMVSGCELMDVVDAAHISPYRGDDDNHPQNGLLLRTDLHTLFDLDLIGIEPRNLIVHVHPAAAHAGYAVFEGSILRCTPRYFPSKSALESRWSLYRGLNSGRVKTLA
jgi:putative restriction endonuclease